MQEFNCAYHANTFMTTAIYVENYKCEATLVACFGDACIMPHALPQLPSTKRTETVKECHASYKCIKRGTTVQKCCIALLILP